MIRLKPEQLARLRKPYDKVGAFKEHSDEEVEKILNEVMDYYVTLARINIHNKNRQDNGNKSTHNE